MSEEILHVEDVVSFKERVRILSRAMSMGQLTRRLSTNRATIFHYAYDEHSEGRKRRNANQKTSIFDKFSSDNIKRNCLMCDKEFLAPNKFKRLCSVCNQGDSWI